MSIYFYFQHGIFSFMFIYARLAIVFYMLPVLGEKILSNLIIKNTIIFLVIIGIWPCVQTDLMPEQGWLISIIKECLIGLILAVIICTPFWVVICLGELFDNQRGATMSDSIDPVNGAQSSIFSGFLNFAFGAIFFASNGMLLFMDILIQSYKIFPRGSDLLLLHGELTGQLLVTLVKNSILLAAPVMLVMLITEVLLGVFARYCPQLNPFSLSLTVKSFIAILIFILYGFHALTEKPLQMISIITFKQLVF